MQPKRRRSEEKDAVREAETTKKENKSRGGMERVLDRRTEEEKEERVVEERDHSETEIKYENDFSFYFMNRRAKKREDGRTKD